MSLYTEGRIFCIIDTETTGLSPVNDYIVEFSAKKYQIKKERLELLGEKDMQIKSLKMKLLVKLQNFCRA